MLGDQALLLEDVQSQSLLHWAQVWVRDSASLYRTEKTKTLLGLTEREIAGQPGGPGMPLSLRPYPSPTYFWSSRLTLCRGNLAVHGLQA